MKNETDQFRIRIAPLSDTKFRPLWSVMIPAYNCTRYLGETLSYIIQQDPGENIMQIEVVDDCSTDGDTEKLVQEKGHGRIKYFRQKQNVGHIHNFETCIKRSRGNLVHLLHGDDYVKRGFYNKMTDAFTRDPEIGAAFCRQVFIDENSKELDISSLEQESSGRLENQLEKLSLEQRIMTPSIVVRREVYEKLGAFDSRLVCSEDWEMWVRIAANYPIWYETEPLAFYRMHKISNTGRHLRSGEDVRYTREAIKIFSAYLPDKKSEYIVNSALNTYAKSAIDNAIIMFWNKDLKGTFSQLREAFRCSRRVSTYTHFLNKFVKSLRQKSREPLHV